jgi:hypothetical protein
MTREHALARLGLGPQADTETIKARFRQLARSHHPDRHFTPVDKLAATKVFQGLAEAYSYLMKNPDPSPGAFTEKVQTDTANWPQRPVAKQHHVGLADLLEIIQDRWPALYAVLDILYAPLIVPTVFTMFPLMLVSTLLKRWPALDNLMATIFLRWLPIGLAGLLAVAAYSKDSVWGAVLFGAAAIAYGLLELLTQILSLARLRTMSTQLQRTLSEAGVP